MGGGIGKDKVGDKRMDVVVRQTLSCCIWRMDGGGGGGTDTVEEGVDVRAGGDDGGESVA